RAGVRPRVKLRILPFVTPESGASHPESAIFLLPDGNHVRSVELHVHFRYLRQIPGGTSNNVVNPERMGRTQCGVVGVSGDDISCLRLDFTKPQRLQIFHYPSPSRINFRIARWSKFFNCATSSSAARRHALART